MSIDSTDADTITSAISARINNSTYFLCIIGEKTYKSAWVKWEINKAVELGKKIVAVKIHPSNTLPDEIVGVGASLAMHFRLESIETAIDDVK